MKYMLIVIAIAVWGQSFINPAHGTTEARVVPSGYGQDRGGRDHPVLDRVELLFDSDISNSVPDDLILSARMAENSASSDLNAHISNAAQALDNSRTWFVAASRQNKQTLYCIEEGAELRSRTKMKECLVLARNAQVNIDEGMKILDQAASSGKSAMKKMGFTPGQRSAQQ